MFKTELALFIIKEASPPAASLSITPLAVIVPLFVIVSICMAPSKFKAPVPTVVSAVELTALSKSPVLPVATVIFFKWFCPPTASLMLVIPARLNVPSLSAIPSIIPSITLVVPSNSNIAVVSN